MSIRSHRPSILAAVLLFCASAAFPQASDLPNELEPDCYPFPECFLARLVFPPGTVSVVQGSATLSASSVGNISEFLSGSRATLQISGLRTGWPVGFPFVLTTTNTSPHPWTAFEIELQSVVGQPSGGDGLSFGTWNGHCPFFLQQLQCFSGPPTSTKFTKLQVEAAAFGGSRDVLLFSGGIVNPGETVTFTFFIGQINPYLTSFFIVQRPLFLVTTDLKPQDDPNCVNPVSSGSVPVAVFGSATFQVSAINQSSLRFGGAPPLSCTIDKVPMEDPALVFKKKDDYPDLVCHFSTQQVSWPAPGTNAGVVTLTGSLNDGTPILGFDTASLAGGVNCSNRTPTFPAPIPQLPADYLTFSQAPVSFTIRGPGYAAGPNAINVSSSKGPVGSLSIPFVNTSNGINWLSANLSASNTLTLSVTNTSALVILAPYTGTVTVRADGNPETDSVLNVGLQVGTCSGLVATPPSWSITVPPFSVREQTFTVTNGDGFVVPAAANVIDFRFRPFFFEFRNNPDGTVSFTLQARAVASGFGRLGLTNPYCSGTDFGVPVPVTVTIGP